MMSERTLRVLEFVKIREMLAEGALTETWGRSSAGAWSRRTIWPR